MLLKKDVDMESRSGSTELYMKENGSIIKLKVKEHSGMPRVTFTLEISKLIKRMDMVSTLMSTGQDMKDNGLMMFKKVKEKRLGLMEPNMLGNIKMVRNMVTAFISGLMEVSLKETGKKIKSPDMVYIIGRMVEFMKDIGTKIICMDQVYTSGQMVVNMKVITLMIKKTGMVFILILMADAIKVNGKTVNNMVKVYL